MPLRARDCLFSRLFLIVELPVLAVKWNLRECEEDCGKDGEIGLALFWESGMVTIEMKEGES